MLDDNIYYTTAGIYGVKMQTRINNECNVLFERQSNTLMSNEMLKEAKAFYANLDENSKRNVKFKLYRNCKSVKSSDNFMIWCDESLNFIINLGI